MELMELITVFLILPVILPMLVGVLFWLTE